MKIIAILVVFSILLIFDGTTGEALDDWVFVEKSQGVTIHSRKLAEHAESEFRGTRILDQPIEVVGAVLADIPAYPRWFFNCIQARKIPDKSSTHLKFQLYIIVKTPWPLWNRDVIYTTESRVDIPSGKIMVWGKAVRDAVIPIKENHVRVTDSALKWVLERLDDSRTMVTFTKRINAGGSIGSYLSDVGCRKTIFESLVNLAPMAADPKYAAQGSRLKEEFGENK
ncbi:MAG: hypothetical protein JRH12_25905 [Deltaproteobacteria bacterium]|jgi:hypothetical protein|nr:hypothetical protein [Deltaproteobacteria bacterium]MBW2480802.1 hypothetical protein [Deltaproteobacteria bacterium]